MLLLHKLKKFNFTLACTFIVVVMVILLSMPKFSNKCIHMAANEKRIRINAMCKI